MNTTSMGVYPFNLLSLLSLLDESELPSSFQNIVINDDEQEWVANAFSVAQQLRFANKGFKMEMEIDHVWDVEYGRKKDLIHITAMMI